jgi:hypothetical protein
VETQKSKKEVDIWKWLLALLDLYGAKGMSSDETAVEDMEIVYWVKILVWHRNIDKYLDCIDDEQTLPNQALFSHSGSKSIRVILCQDFPLNFTMPKTRTTVTAA